ncbi:hypothetical protein QQ008_28080 [Fulvivirgaceae bacterium BMA10]|uniref:Uncharacterized protein n=1 Tax=Splendidivirga corallicola TaxID=3051826 RepID=A0ABT8L0Y0_9BACT|nr:hypothetical protein [Fulvivirgaceae bacterium BMA10]
MSPIAIQIPQISGEQEIEVEVKINGIKQQYNYRVEVFYWKDCKTPPEKRVECLKEIIEGYDDAWVLYQIGMPTDEYVPITFRRKRNSEG